jgi:hypothetical protein
MIILNYYPENIHVDPHLDTHMTHFRDPNDNLAQPHPEQLTQNPSPNSKNQVEI